MKTKSTTEICKQWNWTPQPWTNYSQYVPC